MLIYSIIVDDYLYILVDCDIVHGIILHDLILYDIITLRDLMCLFKLLLHADHHTKCCIRS